MKNEERIKELLDGVRNTPDLTIYKSEHEWSVENCESKLYFNNKVADCVNSLFILMSHYGVNITCKVTDCLNNLLEITILNNTILVEISEKIPLVPNPWEGDGFEMNKWRNNIIIFASILKYIKGLNETLQDRIEYLGEEADEEMQIWKYIREDGTPKEILFEGEE